MRWFLMMTVEDYATDVGKTKEEILALCEKIDIRWRKYNITW